ncbi:MAG: peptidyl-tRNA hydrolase [Rickettsiales bacterium]|jgi:PTH1 family peptidyl-tRNA hydrolase|nr:peptidyl-tRNA hydrolase [Rickettsiales bacterium]
MFLLVGLGNPGSEYAMTRHNVGFMVVDAIADRYGFSPWKKKFQAQMSEGLIGSEKVILLKPTTYMNESGRSVGEAIRFHKIPLEQVFVIHDELDIPFGRLKVKTGGGHAGHNGLRSIDQHVGNPYVRIRFGIAHPGHRDQVTRYVLNPFSKEEQAELPKFLDACAESFPSALKNDMGRFIETYGERAGILVKEPKKPKPEKEKNLAPGVLEMNKEKNDGI